jgi:signal transduction histidine kinase
LAVAKQLIEKVGGTIWCESALGKGACFSFRLPQYQEQVHGSDRQLPGSPAVVEQGSRTAPFA